MRVISPVRRKRKRAPESAPAEAPPESTEITAPPESTAAPESAAAPESPAPPVRSPDPGGLLRNSAVRRFLRREFEFPLQVREAFFTAVEAKIAEDLRRSVARALESKRSTLMTPDA